MHLTEGETIVLELVRVTSRSRVAHVREFAVIFMNAEVQQLCRDCRVEHQVAMEEPR
jgi:hypothetical protein